MGIFYTIASILITIFIYFLQIALSLVLVLIFSFIPYFFLKKVINHAYIVAFSLSLCIIFGSIFYVTNNPIILCNDSYKSSLTDEIREQILDNNSGIYSTKLPIFPIYINVNSINSKSIKYNTKYLYFCSVETEILIGDSVSSKLIWY